ncbi:ChrR family anti-sigma-E factor [Pseudidiomarina taiwanensis]|uniref:Transcriptional regulator n=1 Tax=Pseudidiomarina taiwanensis TaxID=337250 RepID=A0A432ZN07_9GAMM|nr:ChrR family anti-sigma-E factor [Pseudidiomarina taiwanensis]RUO79246.1 transcriptional regulator [Pseudidiomarina taiwanensis]
MIKSHPSEQLLVGYVAGELTPAMLMVVGTHVDMCPHCQQQVQDIEEQLAQKVMQNSSRVSSQLSIAEADAMLERIFNSQQGIQQPVAHEVNNLISLDGKRFTLPPTLARNSRHIGEWQHMVSHLWRAPVQVDEEQPLNLIYMSEGAQVPEHTHKGQEATVVINGVFHDEFDEYRDGDFILLDGHHKHTPATQAEDCLTLATLDAPMQFTSGISRLLNPFSSLFFR